MERKVLGRGLSALIPEKPVADKSPSDVSLVALEKIRPNPLQPRENFDPQSLDELVQSIKEKGVIQPVLVRRKGDYYELIAGERRFRAANILNLKEIPVVVKDVDDQDSLELSLIENIQRQDLNAVEEARAYQYLIDKFQLTQERLSEVLGKARVTVSNTLRLLKLPQEIQEEMRKGRISFGHGRALLEVEDTNHQRRLAQETISKGLSVRELENLIKAKRPKSPYPKTRPGARDPYVAVIEEEMQQILATKVRVTKQKKRGHILIEFYSQEDLDRIINKIRGGHHA
jgi:ParB family transcriptional regulator, chromosome partitioning protein